MLKIYNPQMVKYILLAILILLFVIICTWVYLPKNILEQVESWFVEDNLTEGFSEEGFESDKIDLKNIPTPYTFGLKSDEFVAFTKVPHATFETLQKFFKNTLDTKDMTLIFDLDIHDDNIEQDILSFENLTHHHRVTFKKVPNISSLKVKTNTFSQTSSTNHSEKIRKYELEKYLEKETSKTLEAETTEKDDDKEEGFEDGSKKVTYVITYDGGLTSIFETKKQTAIESAQMNHLLDDMSFTKETVCYIGSSDATSTDALETEDEACLIGNIRLYNRVLTSREMDALLFRTNI